MELAEEMTVKRGSGIQTVEERGRQKLRATYNIIFMDFISGRRRGAARTEGGECIYINGKREVAFLLLYIIQLSTIR
jgi:hypothetical protein